MTNWFDILYRGHRAHAPTPAAAPAVAAAPVADRPAEAEPSAAAPAAPRRLLAENLQPPPPLPPMPSRWTLELQKAAFHLEHETPGQNGSRVVAFSALQPRIGTSTVSYLLAHYLAAEAPDVRVLYVDFSMDGQRGMAKGADQLLRVGETIPADFLVASPLAFTRLSVRSGDDHSVINCSRWFRELIEMARKLCDWVIVDIPPFVASPESYTVSQLCDGTVLVLKSGETRYPALNGLVSDLEQVGIRVAGVVMNFREYPIPRWLLKYI